MEDYIKNIADITNTYPEYPLAELHAHLGSSIDPAVLWQIAHNLGIKLPKDEYTDFRKFVTLSPSRQMRLNDYLRDVYHPILDKLSSGTHAVEAAVYNTMSGAYRNGITYIELRTNPMKHNMNAEVDLDHLTMAMLHGMDKALLEHKSLSAGIIFAIAREYDYEQNAKIIEKAIKYHKRGVVGIDVAGPATNPNFKMSDYTDLFKKAREAGLGLTVHTGEVRDANDMWDVLEHLNPDRIGHGVLAAYDEELMKELKKRGTVLEVCPMSNLATKAIENIDELRKIMRAFVDNGVKFTVNTDWPEIIEKGRLRTQYQMLKAGNILSEEELRDCTDTAFGAGFVKKPGLEAYL
jgi:adenosine deaminase